MDLRGRIHGALIIVFARLALVESEERNGQNPTNPAAQTEPACKLLV